MQKTLLRRWATPIEGMGFFSGLLRAIVYGAGTVALVKWAGWWGLLALPLLVILVWLARPQPPLRDRRRT